jgi:hypothetical protein
MSTDRTDHDQNRVRALPDDGPLGEYRYDLVREEWWWSPDMFALHGFAPGEVVPTTALALAHKHPDDLDRATHVFEAATTGGTSFSLPHRIVSASGSERTVVATGRVRRDPSTGAVVELSGWAADVTAYVGSRAAEEAGAQIRAAAQTRGTIEQAKGMIMLAVGVGADEAFALLRRTSNDRNVPVRTLAALVVRAGEAAPADARDAIVAVLGAPGPGTRVA